MSVSQFGGPTQPIEAGDTPDFDDNQVSRLIDSGETTITKGQASVMVDGQIVIASFGSYEGFSPFVPIETKTRIDGTTEIRGVTADQFVALTHDNSVSAINPGDLVKIGAQEGTVVKWVAGDDANDEKYARYIGKEAGILSQAVGTPFTVSLSTGVIPDQNLGKDEVGWFKLSETTGNTLS